MGNGVGEPITHTEVGTVTERTGGAVQEIMRLTTRVRELEDKYENNPMTCNAGHTSQPMRLWDCPVCTEQLRTRVRELESGVQERYTIHRAENCEHFMNTAYIKGCRKLSDLDTYRNCPTDHHKCPLTRR